MRGIAATRRAVGRGSELAIEPRQERSRDSERKLVTGLTRLLARKPYERITVPQIARAAGLAVGSVYRRFPSKERLLLFAATDLARRTIRPALERTAIRERWAQRSGREQIARYLAFAARTFARHRPLLRAVSLVSRLDIDPELTKLVTSVNLEAHELLRRLLLARRECFGHPDPERAVSLGILWTSAALREVVLFNEPVSHLAGLGGRSQLVEQLADGMWAYLRGGKTAEAN